MSYNVSKFPPDVSRLFKPNPPLEYKRPVDYPPETRQTCPHITGVSQLLEGELSSYLNQFPEGSENIYLQKYQEASHVKDSNYSKLSQDIKKWDPHKDPNIKGTDPFKMIFVGRLPFDTTEMDLQREFCKFGDIERIRVVRDKVTNKSRGYAFILFTNPHSSKMVCREIGVHRGLQIKGRTAIVDIERGRTVKYFKPRRLGGGLGGRNYTKTRRSIVASGPPSKYANRSVPVPRAPYNGPSRFSNNGSSSSNTFKVPNRYGGNMARRFGGENASGMRAGPPTVSYKSRYSRARETGVTKFEEPDY